MPKMLVLIIHFQMAQNTKYTSNLYVNFFNVRWNVIY